VCSCLALIEPNFSWASLIELGGGGGDVPRQGKEVSVPRSSAVRQRQASLAE
jgi:hypothetical protein